MDRPAFRRIALTGGSGFVGAALVARLAPRFELLDLFHRTPVAPAAGLRSLPLDDAALEATLDAVCRWGAQALVHLGAAADVDACERERGDREGPAYRSNVLLPGQLAAGCAARGLRFVHVSTDYVFDGEHGPYREEDEPAQAANWYGQTKLEGERAVRQASAYAAIARIALPYAEPHPRKRDLVRLVRDRLGAGQPFGGAGDQWITPTWVGDIAEGLAALALHDGAGVYHLAGATLLSPFEAALIVARTFGLDERLVQRSTLAAISQAGRAPRPRVPALLSGRLVREMGETLRPKGFAEGVGILRDALAQQERQA